jgi:hypothetical protein
MLTDITIQHLIMLYQNATHQQGIKEKKNSCNNACGNHFTHTAFIFKDPEQQSLPICQFIHALPVGEGESSIPTTCTHYGEVCMTQLTNAVTTGSESVNLDEKNPLHPLHTVKQGINK